MWVFIIKGVVVNVIFIVILISVFAVKHVIVLVSVFKNKSF